MQKLPQWFLPLRWLAFGLFFVFVFFLSKNDVRKLGIFEVGSNVEFGGGNQPWKKSASMRKLTLRYLVCPLKRAAISPPPPRRNDCTKLPARASKTIPLECISAGASLP